MISQLESQNLTQSSQFLTQPSELTHADNLTRSALRQKEFAFGRETFFYVEGCRTEFDCRTI